MKRTPLRKASKKKRQERAATDKERRAYVESHEVCEYCECTAPTDCHEIAAGSYRAKAVYEPLTWLALCRECHELLQSQPIRLGIAFKAWTLPAATRGTIKEAFYQVTGRKF